MPSKFASIQIDVAFTAAGATASQMENRVVCVIDVLRASTTITTALAAGADAIWPEATIESAEERKRTLTQQGLPVLLAGERNAFPPPGFDLGNSPADFTSEKVADRQVVLTTTNGTLALTRAVAAGARQIYVAAFANLGAIVQKLLEDAEANSLGAGVLLLAAGSEGRVSLEDTACAGMIIHRLTEQVPTQRPTMVLTDAARVALQCYLGAGPDWAQTLRGGDHAQNLLSAGFQKDVNLCLATDTLTTVVYWEDGRLKRSSD